MNSFSIKIVILVFISVFYNNNSQAQQEIYTLGLNMSSGGVYYKKVETEIRILQTVMGIEQEINQFISADLRFDAQRVRLNSSTPVQVTFERIILRINGLGINARYDSQNPGQSSSMLSGFNAFAGESFNIQLTRLGRISRVTGLSEIFADFENSGDNRGFNLGRMFVESMVSQLDENSVTVLLENMLAVYPPRPVRIGDSWQSGIVFNMGKPSEVSTLYTLAAHGRDTTALDLNITVQPDPDAIISSPKSGLTFDISGSGRGKMTLDTGTGWVASGFQEISLEGTLGLSGFGTEAVSFPIKIDQTIRYSGRINRE